MSMLKAINNAITKVADTVADTADTATSGISIANTYVSNREIKFRLTDTQQVQLDTAITLNEIAEQLEDNANLKIQFDLVAANWK